MGYAEHLKRMLRPLGVYDLVRGYSSAELEAVGHAFDLADTDIENALNAAKLENLDAESLKKLERLFPIVNLKGSNAERLKAVKTLLSADETWSGKNSLMKMLDACGVAASIVEGKEKYVAQLHFTSIRGEPDDEEKETCRAVMPAHIALKYVCKCLTWNRAETLFPTWAAFDGAGLTADELIKLE